MKGGLKEALTFAFAESLKALLAPLPLPPSLLDWSGEGLGFGKGERESGTSKKGPDGVIVVAVAVAAVVGR